MSKHRKITLMFFVSALALSVSAQAAPIASVHEVINSATHTPPGSSVLPVRVDDQLNQNEAIETAPQSAVQMVFVDGSELRLEESSKITLDNYVYDPHAQASNGLVNLSAGIFRFTSNGVNDQGVILKSPAATIGIRGTDIVVNVQKGGVTVVDVLEGKVFIKPKGLGKGADVVAGQSGMVGDPNQDAAVGDIGAFATAAGGLPAGPPTPNGHADDHTHDFASNRSSGPTGNSGGGNDGGGGGNGGGGGDGGGDGGGGDTNGSGSHSGLGDHSNPGKGDDHSHSGNGGSNNPGGSK